MKKHTRRTYENPFVVYCRLGKNFVYDTTTHKNICIKPVELGFKGIASYLEKHFKNMKNWREVIQFLEKHNKKYGDKCFTYPNQFNQITEDITTEFDDRIEALFEDFFEGTLVVKPKRLRLKLKRI